MNEDYESSNINTKWLENIYENLKNLEVISRNAREGCSSLLEYLQIPLQSKAIIIADVKYKNLRFMVTEMDLLLTDLTPVLEEEKLNSLRETLNKIEPLMKNRDLFVEESFSASSNSINHSENTDLFNETLKFLLKLRIDIIKSISHILYMSKSDRQSKQEATQRII